MPLAPAAVPQFQSDFATAFTAMLGEATCLEIFRDHGPRRAGSPKLTPWQWIASRVFHELAFSGTFSANVMKITRQNVSDAALSQRGQSMGVEIFTRILQAALQPLADAARHPEAFHRGYRLLAFDGTRFNLRNTQAINAVAVKNKCSKGSGVPAFAHMPGVVLVELGLHQPLAASFSWKGEGELTLVRRILESQPLPERGLVLADRLYGTPSLLWQLKPLLEASSGALLFRVRSNLKATPVKSLPDGSWLVSVAARDPETNDYLGEMELREIRAEIHHEGGEKPQPIRLWTSLLDQTLDPAGKLVELYTTRWEEELFFRELKSHLHGRNNLLDGQTPETAAQEVLAMLLAASLIARQREAVAAVAKTGILRISFAKVLHTTTALWDLLAVGADLIDPGKLGTWVTRILEDLKKAALIQKRKPRSCPRTLRQPVKDWPKTKLPSSKAIVKTIVISNP